MTKQTYAAVTSKLSTQIALVSFGIGTFLFLMQQLFPREGMIFMCGFIYVLIAFLVNGIVLLNLLHHFVFFTNHREYFGIKLLIVLANLPIVALYFYIIVMNIKLFTF